MLCEYGRLNRQYSNMYAANEKQNHEDNNRKVYCPRTIHQYGRVVAVSRRVVTLIDEVSCITPPLPSLTLI